MEYEDYNEEGLHYRRKRPKNEEPLPPSKRYVVDNAQARKALATIVETKKTSKAKVPEFPEIGLKVKSSYADKPSNIRVLYLIEEIADQMKANLKESYIEHPILLNASISMLDEIFENCKTELNKYNDFKHRQLEEEAKINEDIKKLKSDEDTKWKRINSLFRINPDNLFKQNEKLYLENAIESSKNAYKKLKILDLNIEDDKYPQFGSKDTISNNIKSLPVKLKEKTKRNLTNVASYAEETLRRKQEHTRDRCYQVSDDFGPFLSVFYADSRGLVSAFTKLNI